MHRSTEDINGGGGGSVCHTFCSARSGILHLIRASRDVPAPPPPQLASHSQPARRILPAAFPFHYTTSSYKRKAIGWTLDMALLLDVTRPKAFHRGSNEVTGVCFRQL